MRKHRAEIQCHAGKLWRMKLLILGFVIVLFLAPGAIASEESMLVHVTCYWRNEKSGHRAAWNGAHLRAGDCAVDPRKIPYGSTIIFPDVKAWLSIPDRQW